ncbi:Ser/Thr protein kinase RdoA (MazF antagonist) [Promicromonospora sp. AC04]|uniref:phosphotransferase n=1 Tax=Promicromonospora sp. AC04 TaxID=2135723 RepID=UPI000D33D390|nr:aminoglycoside phosphotransferase family protein [Promicromonospora sp. AC04]PUB32581.1 Ser/Thr protein kinase RdoA (MazF antagonist) [Promicromonospora sp. AC04]
MTSTTDFPSPFGDLLSMACEHAGLDATGARLIKLTNNAVFSLARDPYVIRIAASDLVGAQARKAVSFAQWLAANDVPTIVPMDGLDQPFDVEGHQVTIWQLVPSNDGRPTVRALAEILRTLHSSPGEAPDLPAWDEIGSIRRKLSAQDVLSTEHLVFLTDQVDELATLLHDVDYVLPTGPIHGDAHTGSLIAGTDGTVLCDFDTAANGPREWDLMPIAVNTARFAELTDEQDQLADEYGFDVRDWDHYDTMRRIRELQVLVAPLPILSFDAGVRTEWNLRYESIRAGNATAVWTPWNRVDLAARSNRDA